MGALNKECIFCKIANKVIPSKIVYEDEEILAFHDIKPEAPVHILVIPKFHIESIADLNQKNIEFFDKMVLVANKIALEAKINNSGYRLVVNKGRDAGQAVNHLHLHILGGRMMAWPPG